LNNQKGVILPSWSRAWIIYQYFLPDWSSYRGLEVECRGDGKVYQIQYFDQGYIQIENYYYHPIKPDKNMFQIYKLYFNHFSYNRAGVSMGKINNKISLESIKAVGFGIEDISTPLEYNLEIKSLALF
jgi:hypothetical protein